MNSDIDEVVRASVLDSVGESVLDSVLEKLKEYEF